MVYERNRGPAGKAIKGAMLHMRLARITALAFLAFLAVNAVALPGGASAALLPDFLPEPTAAEPITFTNKGGKTELIKLGEELGSEKVVKCEKSTSKDELTTPKLGKGEIKFERCSFLKGICESLDKTLKEGIVVKGKLHIQSGFEKEVEVPAFVFLPENTHFTCGASLFLILQSSEDLSCFAGKILEPNTLAKVVKVQFKEKVGDPEIVKLWNDEDTALYECKVFFNIDEGALLVGAIGMENELELEGFKKLAMVVTALIDF